MLSEEEEKFLIDWENKRVRKKSPLRRISLGLPLGLLISSAILLNYFSGWYTRATMVANGQSTPLVLILGAILITIFCTVFYQRHKWEMNEQRYLELLHKKKMQNTTTSMQQDGEINSQVNN